MRRIHQKMGIERLCEHALALLPIGSYKPSRYTRQHVSPRQAAQIHRMVQSKHSIAMHWGTFGDMTFEELEDPPRDLQRARKELQIPAESFHTLRHGEIVEVMR